MLTQDKESGCTKCKPSRQANISGADILLDHCGCGAELLEEEFQLITLALLCVLRRYNVNVKYRFETPEIKKVYQVYEMSYGLAAYFDEVKAFNFDRYFSDRGVFVRPEFRGLGIGQKFLNVRRMICKEHNIPIHGAWTTSYGAQKAAERDGWETVCKIPIEEFERKHGDV